MRWVVLLCSAMFITVWLLPKSVVAGNALAAAVSADPQSQAQSLEESLRAVEWYTNEAVRKALQAEAVGDIPNARLFGDKAIESDKKAQGLRNETAVAWLAVNEKSNEQAVWHRAAGMAEERAVLLAKRIPSLSAQWDAARAALPATAAPDIVAKHREQEIIYLQAIYLTAQQWAVTADFFTRAAEQDKADKARAELQALVPLLVSHDRLQALADDARLKDAYSQARGWQAGKLP